MIIKNALVYTEDKYFEEGNIYIKDGVFSEEFDDDELIIDAQGCYAVPGLVDVHFHGCVGYDFCDASTEAIQKIAEYEAANGITTIVPATMTLSEEHLMKMMKAAKEYKGENGAALAGIHLEGPYISHAKKGAQSPKYIRKPDAEEVRRLQEASGGLIKICDVAPEQEGAMEFIEALKSEMTISLSHTASDYDTALEAYERGASHTTHLYNGMNGFAHREPGVVGAAKDSWNARVELICDGVHVHPSVVRGTFDMFGDDRIVMISDSLRAVGIPDGIYSFEGQQIQIKGKLVTLYPEGTIAGSCVNLMECVRTAVTEMDIPLESAIACATINPARSANIDDKYGSISVGKVGNVVLLNYDLTVNTVILNGKILDKV